jgi:sulfide:quinone oxidoreductase
MDGQLSPSEEPHSPSAAAPESASSQVSGSPPAEAPEVSSGVAPESPSAVAPAASPSEKPHVVIVGGGVAALEAALALATLVPGRARVTVVAPNAQFAYRPLAVREPFAYGSARRYPLGRIVGDAEAELLADELHRVDQAAHEIHTAGGLTVPYDTLVLALGAHARVRYKHALTIDDRRLDETLHGLIQDIEGGYIQSLAFVAPGRMAWPLPLYELALMTSARAQDMGLGLTSTIVTPEDAPLAIFGQAASDAVAQRLSAAGIEVLDSAYAEVPSATEVLVNPGERRLRVQRTVALPELYGPCIRGVPLGEHGFIRVDLHGRVLEAQDIYAAGDATAFAVKHGGLGAQQADAAAEAIAAELGAPLAPRPFRPVIQGMLLTGEKPLYLTARITGGQGFSSEVSDAPTWSPPSKIASRYLAPYLEDLDAEQDAGGEGRGGGEDPAGGESGEGRGGGKVGQSGAERTVSG